LFIGTDTNATFVATLPMVGTHGEQYMPARAKFDGRGFYVTIQAEKDGKMEAIMRVVDYLFSEEGTKLINFGIEGQHYTMVNGAPVLNKEILDGRLPVRPVWPTRLSSCIGLRPCSPR